jgi:predicted Ser/Thr protein kinase/tetratricopeptide (TPR) repeat protein
MSEHGEMERLERALQLWLDFSEGRESGAPGDPGTDAFLAAHSDLRDLLEPLLAGESADDESPASVEASPFTPGAEFDDFRVLRVIGKGGMGVVFETRQKSLDRNVALKALAPHIAANPKSIARFRREALTAARLEHQGIVDVHSVGETEGVHWFAMELIDGPPLNEFAVKLRRDNPSDYLRVIVRLIVAVCRAVDYAHLSGVVHRDLKPSNIMVRADGAPVITDFGLSRELDLPAITQSGEFAGTPYYVSPEQVRGGSAAVGPRADVFALGVTLYELVTAKRPFEGSSTQAVFHQILNRQPVPPEQVDTAVPRDLGAVIARALEKREQDRYPSAAELADDLERFLRGGPVLARRVGLLGRGIRYVRRDPVRMFAAIAVSCAIFVLLAFGTYVWWTDRATSAGQHVLTTDRVEMLFLDAVMAPYATPEKDGRVPGAAEKQRLVDEAMRIGGQDPYVVLQAVYYTMRKGGRKQRLASATRALAMFEACPKSTQEGFAPMHLRRLLLERLDRRDEASELAGRIGAPRNSLDHYFLAELALVGVGHSHDEGRQTAVARALKHARLAVAMMARPRSEYLLQLKRAAMSAGDRDAERIAVDALVEHWPESAAAWAHKALTYDGHDDVVARVAAERSLRLRPDNLFGLAVMGHVANSSGDKESAKRIYTRARKLYPSGSRFFQLGPAVRRR